jgi:hypothetical protein
MLWVPGGEFLMGSDHVAGSIPVARSGGFGRGLERSPETTVTPSPGLPADDQ